MWKKFDDYFCILISCLNLMINFYDVFVLYLKNCMIGSIKLIDDKYDSFFFFFIDKC